MLRANDRVNKVWSFFGPIVTLLTEAGLLVVWAFGAWQVFHGQIKIGVLMAFLGFIGRFYSRLDSMSRMLAAVQRAAASTQRIFEILDRVPSVAEPADPVHPRRLRGEVEFRNVGFRYGNRPVLEDVELTIQPGEMIGLVGPSGSGKSTLVNLVCRFYDVNEGAILVDGMDIRTLALEDYRRHIGIVLQEPFLFYGTIAENIAYGRPEATREEIIAAARAARAHEFILRLTDGYDSHRRRAGTEALRRRAATDFDRPGAVDRPADPDPRRSHLVGRHRDRAGDSTGAGSADPGPHDDRHRPPAEHAAAGGSDRRPRARPDRRNRPA